MEELINLSKEYLEEHKGKNVQSPMDYLAVFGVERLKGIIKNRNGKIIKFTQDGVNKRKFSFKYV